jgi:hypothetical protein
MKPLPDSLVRLRRMCFDRTAADTSRAAQAVNGARELLDAKKAAASSIEDRRSSMSTSLDFGHHARWFAQHWAFDRLLAEDLKLAREEVSRAESELGGKQERFGEQRKSLAVARARLRAVQSLHKRRRRAIDRRRERRVEDEVSEIQTRCL